MAEVGVEAIEWLQLKDRATACRLLHYVIDTSNVSYF